MTYEIHTLDACSKFFYMQKGIITGFIPTVLPFAKLSSNFFENNIFWKWISCSYIQRRPQNLRWRFRKTLWLSQNIWTLSNKLFDFERSQSSSYIKNIILPKRLASPKSYWSKFRGFSFYTYTSMSKSRLFGNSYLLIFQTMKTQL